MNSATIPPNTIPAVNGSFILIRFKAPDKYGCRDTTESKDSNYLLHIGKGRGFALKINFAVSE